ncbi:MAG: hypothetical protein ACT4QC_08285 [Planctomycetaceae bacterium]
MDHNDAPEIAGQDDPKSSAVQPEKKRGSAGRTALVQAAGGGMLAESGVDQGEQFSGVFVYGKIGLEGGRFGAGDWP